MRDEEWNPYRKFRAFLVGLYVLGAAASTFMVLFMYGSTEGVFPFLPAECKAVQRALYAPMYYFIQFAERGTFAYNVLPIILGLAMQVLGVIAIFRSDNVEENVYANRFLLMRTLFALICIIFMADYAALVTTGHSSLSALQKYPTGVLSSPLRMLHDSFTDKPPEGLFRGFALLAAAIFVIYAVLNLIRVGLNVRRMNQDSGPGRKKPSRGNILRSIIAPAAMFVISAAVWIPLGWLIGKGINNEIPIPLTLLIFVLAFLGVGVIWALFGPISFCNRYKGAFRGTFWIHVLVHACTGILCLGLSPLCDAGGQPSFLKAYLPEKAVESFQAFAGTVDSHFPPNGVMTIALFGTGLTMLVSLASLLYCWLRKCPVCGCYLSRESTTHIGKLLGTYMGEVVEEKHVSTRVKTKQGYISGETGQQALDKARAMGATPDVTQYGTAFGHRYGTVAGKNEIDVVRTPYTRYVYKLTEITNCRYCEEARVVRHSTHTKTSYGSGKTTRRTENTTLHVSD